MDNGESAANSGSKVALAFGSLIRSRRKMLKMRQDQLALLEAGKPTCQLGRSLMVAEALGLRLDSIVTSGTQAAAMQELPDLPEEVGE